MRRNIYDILQKANIDLNKEYSRIYDLFYNTYFYDVLDEVTLYDTVNEYFFSFDKKLIKRCLTLDDFDEEFGFNFEEEPNDFNIDYLVSFSEYVVNLVFALINSQESNIDDEELFKVIEHVDSCMEDFGYTKVSKESIYIYVEKDSCALSVAEMVDESLAYSVLQYNHYRLKGDLESKLGILRAMAHEIENKRNELKSINSNFTSDLFQLINKFIRHNNDDNAYIASLTNLELEEIYDDIYQMWLYANMMLKQNERKNRIEELIKNIN